MSSGQIVSEALTLVADELVAMNNKIDTANRPVIEALGSVMAKLSEIQADFRSYQESTNAEISTIRRKVALNGSYRHAE